MHWSKNLKGGKASIMFDSNLNTQILILRARPCPWPKGLRSYKKNFSTGWGRTVGGGPAANILQQGMLPVVSDARCKKRNGNLLPVDKTSMLCAGSGKKNQPGGCQGDSGGPFVCKENGKWVLRGAVSWGHRMCKTTKYTVFARISNFIDWINQNISGGNSGGNTSGRAF